MELILTLAYAFIFLVIILKSSFFRSEKIHSKYFGLVFILKICAGILLGYLYRIYFNGGDTYVFFSDANRMFEIGKSHPVHFIKMLIGFGNQQGLDVYYSQLNGWNNYEYFYNDSKTIIRINAVIRIFTFGYYNVHIVFFSFLSLIGLNGLYKIFLEAFQEKEKEIFISVFLVPSVLFWTSGILKEGILVFSLGIFLYSFTKMISARPYVRRIFSFFVCLVILVYLKIYTLMMIIPGMVAYWWCMKTSYKNCFKKFSISYFLYFILLFNLKSINSNYNLSEIIYWKQHNGITFAKYMNAGSFVEPPLVDPDVRSIVKNIPHALLNTFIFPNWNQIHNPFALAAALENLLIMIVIFMSIIFSASLKSHQKPVFYLSLFFVFFLFTLIGLTTPLIGSMVRYKVPALPFLISMMVMILNKEKAYGWWKGLIFCK